MYYRTKYKITLNTNQHTL